MGNGGCGCDCGCDCGLITAASGGDGCCGVDGGVTTRGMEEQLEVETRRTEDDLWATIMTTS